MDTLTHQEKPLYESCIDFMNFKQKEENTTKKKTDVPSKTLARQIYTLENTLCRNIRNIFDTVSQQPTSALLRYIMLS